MLIGFARKHVEQDEPVLIFAPSHLTVYVGKDIYAAILGQEVEGLSVNKRDEPVTEVVEEEGVDIFVKIEEAVSKPQGICCLRLNNLDEELVGKIAKDFPDESIFVLAPEFPPLSSRAVTLPDPLGHSRSEVFGSFVSDVTGYRPRVKETTEKKAYQSHLSERPSHPVFEPIPVPKRTQKANQIENEPAKPAPKRELFTRFRGISVKEAVKRHAKADFPNLAFACVFVLLTFATTLGYFFLASTSNTFFEVTCIIMAATFPILSCVPIGFLYADAGRTLRPIRLSFLSYLIVYTVLVLACSFIVFGLGKSFGWDDGKLILYFCFNLSSILWSIIRILIEPLFNKLKK